MQNIQKYYTEKVEKLFYKEYLRFILLLCKPHDKVKRYIVVKYYTIINRKNIKF